MKNIHHCKFASSFFTLFRECFVTRSQFFMLLIDGLSLGSKRSNGGRNCSLAVLQYFFQRFKWDPFLVDYKMRMGPLFFNRAQTSLETAATKLRDYSVFLSYGSVCRNIFIINEGRKTSYHSSCRLCHSIDKRNLFSLYMFGKRAKGCNYAGTVLFLVGFGSVLHVKIVSMCKLELNYNGIWNV